MFFISGCNNQDEPPRSTGTVTGDTASPTTDSDAGTTTGDSSGPDSGGDSGTTTDATSGPSTDGDPGATTGTTSEPATGGDSGATTGSTDTDNNQDYSLSVENQTINLIEGTDLNVPVQIQRSNGHERPVGITAEGQSPADVDGLQLKLSETNIPGTQNSVTLEISSDYSAVPIQAQARPLRLRATDGTKSTSLTLNLNLQPTDLADVYLLIGQSNMVGSSEVNAKQIDGDDATVERIRQLNVTGNDQQNFKVEASFTDDNAIAAASPRYPKAEDPLHNGYDTSNQGKSGTRIGLGLSFAKRAIENTNASNIYLVPAAWADTGFCRRERDEFEGSLGWNVEPTLNPAFSGTLLHDRAIARTNMTLRETGGILRGILWHQGEADADSLECAEAYKQNLIDMVASMRSEIIEDPRGPSARGADANIPFVVGSMSKAAPYNVLEDPKLIVDDVHRNIDQSVKFSSFVNSDDLIPPDYPCAADCIHFGSRSYRLMGARYYDQLLEAANAQ